MGGICGSTQKSVVDPAGALALLDGRARRLGQRGLLAPNEEEECNKDGFTEKLLKTEGLGFLEKFGIGCVCKKGMKPQSPNQDDFCAFHTDMCTLVGVFDGHGPFGHKVAHFVQSALPKAFLQSKSFKESGGREVESALKEAFKETNTKCLDNEAFDCKLSGTTATLVFLRQKMLYIAHVGDSQAMVGCKPAGTAAGAALTAEVLTKEHRLTDDSERQRVEEAGGEVKQLEGDIPFRVFLKGQLYPGLTISRAFGDGIGAEAGVSCEPDVIAMERRPTWQFLLLCSDGVWEFLEHNEAVNLVAKFPPAKAKAAAEALAKEAWDRWVKGTWWTTSL